MFGLLGGGDFACRYWLFLRGFALDSELRGEEAGGGWGGWCDWCDWCAWCDWGDSLRAVPVSLVDRVLAAEYVAFLRLGDDVKEAADGDSRGNSLEEGD